MRIYISRLPAFFRIALSSLGVIVLASVATTFIIANGSNSGASRLHPLRFLDRVEDEAQLQLWEASRDWQVSSESVHSGNNAWRYQTTQPGSMNSSLTLSGVLDARKTTNLIATWWDKYTLMVNDSMVVEVRPSNESNWTTVFSHAGGTQGDWVERRVNLSAYNGALLELRFVVISSGKPDQFDRWYIDDIDIGDWPDLNVPTITPVPLALRLLPVCAGSWAVQNYNDYSLNYTWRVVETGQSASGVVAGASQDMFYTDPFPKTVVLTVQGVQQDMQPNSTVQCTIVTSTPTSTSTATTQGTNNGDKHGTPSTPKPNTHTTTPVNNTGSVTSTPSLTSTPIQITPPATCTIGDLAAVIDTIANKGLRNAFIVLMDNHKWDNIIQKASNGIYDNQLPVSIADQIIAIATCLEHMGG